MTGTRVESSVWTTHGNVQPSPTVCPVPSIRSGNGKVVCPFGDN